MNPSDPEKSMRQRMLDGELYIASDRELWELHLRSQRILQVFNLSHPDAAQQRQTLIQELFGAVGANCEIKPPFPCDYGFNIFAGESLYSPGLFPKHPCIRDYPLNFYLQTDTQPQSVWI